LRKLFSKLFDHSYRETRARSKGFCFSFILSKLNLSWKTKFYNSSFFCSHPFVFFLWRKRKKGMGAGKRGILLFRFLSYCTVLAERYFKNSKTAV
jgi:hypothetical protein